MRHLILVCAALTLAACGQQEQQASDCTLTATNEIAWRENGARIVLAASTAGDACEQASATLEFRGPDNTPRHTISASLHALMIGGDAPENAPPIAREDAERFLVSWVEADAFQASGLPAWAANTPHPGDGGALPYRTSLDRTAYEALRARDDAVLCVAVRVDGVECFTIEPDTGNVESVLGYAP